MTVTAASGPRTVRPRPRLIAVLRVLLPTVAALTTLAVVVSLASHMIRAAADAQAPARPELLVAPRLIGADEKQRPFVITAESATRETGSLQRVRLTRPELVRNQGGDDEMRVRAASGIYDEGAGRLELSGGVKLVGSQGEFSAPSAIYDTKKGELMGRSGVQASGSGGELQAGSFEVKDGGKSVVYKGGVHTRINPK